MEHDSNGQEEPLSDDAKQDALDEAWSESAGLEPDVRPVASEPEAVEAPALGQTQATTAQGSVEPVPLETLENSVGSHLQGKSPVTPAQHKAGKASPDASPRPAAATFSQTWASARTAPEFPTRLVVVGVLGAGVLGISAWAYLSTDLWPQIPMVSPPDVETLIKGTAAHNDSDAYLRDILAAKRDAAHEHDPVLAAAKAEAPSPPHSERLQQHATKRRERPVSAPAAVTAPQMPEDFYGSIFGSSERYAAASGRPSSRGVIFTTDGTDRTPNVQGAVVGARFLDEVASEPAGAPVIAAVRRRATVGGLQLLPGMELHGNVTGSSDTRVFVTFTFVRTPEGDHIALRGSARDDGGRTGIPGRRQLTRNTAGSVGVASLSSGLAAAGRSIANDFGEALGAAIEAAGESSAEKARRVDRDEYVVVVAQGTTFSVYIESVSARDS